jgi:DNA polymerase-3 subunit gamma/tau
MDASTGTPDDEPGLPGFAAPNPQPAPYRVLARKYRPTHFGDLIGQEAMVRTLGNAFAAKRIPQAWMLTGVRGVGKTTTARILARGLNYARAGVPDTGPTVDMPELGLHCAAIMESRHMDVLEMDAASHTGIDDVRAIIDGIRYGPVSARYKVYIVDEVHMLSEKAFNAFLKTLEDPPPHAKFVFATTEIRKVPVTILSRCQRFDLRRVEAPVLRAHLARICEAEGVGVEEEALNALVRAAEGSVRDSLSLLDQAIAHGAGTVTAQGVRDMLGLADRARVVDLFEAVMRGAVPAAFAELRSQYDAGADPAVVISDLATFTHLVTRLKIVPEAASDPSLSETERGRGAEFAQKLSVRALSRAWQILLKAIPEVQAAPRPLAAAEMAIVRLAYAADLPTPDEALRRLRDEGADVAPSPAAVPSLTTAPATPRSLAPAPPPAPAPELRAVPTALRPVPAAPSSAPLAAPPPAKPPLVPPASTPLAAPASALARSAPAPAREPAPASGPRLLRFEDVVAMADARRDILLKSALEREVHLVRFEEGRIEMRLAQGGRSSLANDLSAALTAWTGCRWIVALSQEEGAPTLAEGARMATETRRENAAADPFVREALTRFPGAEIVDVRETASEARPTAEQEILGDLDAARVEEAEGDDL